MLERNSYIHIFNSVPRICGGADACGGGAGAKRRVRGVDGEINIEAAGLNEQQRSVSLVALARPQMAVVAVLAAHHKNGVANSGSAAALARRAHACHVVPRIAAAEAREELEAAAYKHCHCSTCQASTAPLCPATSRRRSRRCSI